MAVDGDRHGIRLRRRPHGRRFHARQASAVGRGRRLRWRPTAAGRTAACGWKPASYRLTASGRYQVAKTTKVWWCEPGGVSIRYYKGRPLGILLAAVRPDHPAAGSTTALLHPTVVGLGTTLSPRRNRHALLQDQRLGRRIGRQRRRVEGGSAARIGGENCQSDKTAMWGATRHGEGGVQEARGDNRRGRGERRGRN